MKILTIRTDKPEAELGLYDDNNESQYYKWEAHRQLAETIHLKLSDLLNADGTDLHMIEGIVVYLGPGSFTGLRIGITVANALASSLEIPIVGGVSQDWQLAGIGHLVSGENDGIVLPEYGALPNVSAPKK